MYEFLNVMLVDPDMVKANSDLSYNVDDAFIGSSIRVSQNVYLKDAIGVELVQKLQELVWNGIQNSGSSIDDEENIAYKTLLDSFVIPALSYKVASEIGQRLSYKIRNFGVVKNSDTNVNYADYDEIVSLQETYETYFNDALNKLVDFICQNNGAFPEANFDCNCGGGPKFARTALWLGPTNKRKK